MDDPCGPMSSRPILWTTPITPVSEEELYRLSGQILGTLIILGYTTIIKIFISNSFEWKFSGILYHYNEFHPMHVIAGHTLLLNPVNNMVCQRSGIHNYFTPNLMSVQIPSNHSLHSMCGAALSPRKLSFISSCTSVCVWLSRVFYPCRELLKFYVHLTWYGFLYMQFYFFFCRTMRALSYLSGFHLHVTQTHEQFW